MEYVLKPMSVHLKVPRGKKLRFAEQSWLVVYYSISFCSGLVRGYTSVENPCCMSC